VNLSWNQVRNLTLTPKQKLILKWASVPVLYLLCLLVFVRVTFPYGALKARLIAEFNARSKERMLEIKDLSGAGLFGIEAEGVRLVPITRDASAVAGLAFDSATVSVAPLSALIGNIGVDYHLEVGGGEIQGSFFQNDEAAEFELTSDAVDISGLSVLADMIGLPLGGTLGGDVELKLPQGKMSEAEGKFAFNISDLTVGDGKAKVRNTIALPKINAGNLVLDAKVEKGRMDVSELSAQGPDLDFKAEGKVRLREPFDKSVVDVDAGFQFKEAYTSQSDLTKSIFGSPDGKVPGLFDMDPNVRKAKDDKGYYRWRVSGLLAKPSFRPVQPKATKGD
jgi:type II secretion system protein N